MSTLATLFEALATARRAGADFDTAWDTASVEALAASCNAGDWQPVLDTTRASREAAYHGWPASSPERALSLLGFDATVADVERSDRCRRCGSVIPVERGRRGALFCSDRCRRAYHSARARERVTA